MLRSFKYGTFFLTHILDYIQGSCYTEYMNNKQFPLPAYIIELDQALDEGLAKAIPVIVKQIDAERKKLTLDRLNDLLRTRQYTGANTDYLNGIREAIEVLND